MSAIEGNSYKFVLGLEDKDYEVIQPLIKSAEGCSADELVQKTHDVAKLIAASSERSEEHVYSDLLGVLRCVSKEKSALRSKIETITDTQGITLSDHEKHLDALSKCLIDSKTKSVSLFDLTRPAYFGLLKLGELSVGERLEFLSKLKDIVPLFDRRAFSGRICPLYRELGFVADFR